MQCFVKNILIYTILIFLGTNAYADYINLEDIGSFNLPGHSTLLKNSKSCGKFYALRNNFSELERSQEDFQFFAYGGKQELKYKRKGIRFKKQATGDLSYKSPQAQVYIYQSSLDSKNYPKHESYLKQALLSKLRERAKKKLELEFAQADATVLAHFDQHVDKVHKVLFKESGKPTTQIRVILAFFPELVDEIIYNEFDELRPLLCLIKLREHNIKMFNRWTNLLIPPAIILGVAAGVTGSAGLILPPLAIAAGVSACLLGIRDISLGAYWAPSKERAAYVAGKMQIFYKESQLTLKNLRKKEQKKPLTEDEIKLLRSLEELSTKISRDREKTLSKVVKAKNFNRVLISFGILNAGFNGLNLTGDPTLLPELPGVIFSLIGLS